MLRVVEGETNRAYCATLFVDSSLGRGTSCRGFASPPAPWGVSELAFRTDGTVAAGSADRNATRDAGLAIRFIRQPMFNNSKIQPPSDRNGSQSPQSDEWSEARGNIPRRAREAVLVAGSIVCGLVSSPLVDSGGAERWGFVGRGEGPGRLVSSGWCGECSMGAAGFGD